MYEQNIKINIINYKRPVLLSQGVTKTVLISRPIKYTKNCILLLNTKALAASTNELNTFITTSYISLCYSQPLSPADKNGVDFGIIHLRGVMPKVL